MLTRFALFLLLSSVNLIAMHQQVRLTPTQAQQIFNPLKEELCNQRWLVLQKIRAINKKYKDDSDFGRAMAESPIFMLDECGDAGCPLNSSEDMKNPRVAFENHTVPALVNHINRNPQQMFHYVSFASGRLFPDLVLLTRVFSQTAPAAVTLHVIDPIYTDQKNHPMINQFFTALSMMFPGIRFDVKLYSCAERFLETKIVPSALIAADLDLETVETEESLVRLYKKMIVALLKRDRSLPINYLLRSPLTINVSTLADVISFTNSDVELTNSIFALAVS